MPRPQNAYERGLVQTQQCLEQMSTAVSQRLTEAVKAFVEYDNQLASQIVDSDDEVDVFDELLEKDCLELIAMQQPIDEELRLLMATVRIGHELERIADFSCDIAEVALHLNKKQFGYGLPGDLLKMAERVQSMLTLGIHAYIERDLPGAQQMDSSDDEVDRLFISLQEQLMTDMKRNPAFVDQACGVMLVSRYLERIGDHIVNIAEMSIFVETGERHLFKQMKRKAAKLG